MLKKKGLLVALMGCVLALCLGLVACGGGVDPKEDFIGTWELESSAGEGGPEITAEDLAMMKEMDMVCTLTMAEDGTFVLDIFGEIAEGTWEATDVHEGTATLEDSEAKTTIGDDGKLTLDEDGFKMIFVPQVAEDAAADDAAEESEEA